MKVTRHIELVPLSTLAPSMVCEHPVDGHIMMVLIPNTPTSVHINNTNTHVALVDLETAEVYIYQKDTMVEHLPMAALTVL